MLYVNGEIIPSSQAKLDLDDRGLLLGDGLFETMRVYKGKVIHLARHWSRLSAGADVLKMQLAITCQELSNIIAKLLVANANEQADLGLRLTVTRGTGQRGLLPENNNKPTIIITPFSLPTNKAFYSAHIATSVKRNEYSPLSQLKTINYLDNILARLEAADNAADDAILINTRGHVTETSVANVFLVKNNRIFTPPKTDGVLPGIMRAVVFELTKQLNIGCEEKPITPEELFTATEIFLTNSIIEIKPLIEINKTLLHQGEVGPITKKLMDAYKIYVTNRLKNY